jgi:hypothetical protein
MRPPPTTAEIERHGPTARVLLVVVGGLVACAGGGFAIALVAVAIPHRSQAALGSAGLLALLFGALVPIGAKRVIAGIRGYSRSRSHARAAPPPPPGGAG